MKNKIYQNLQDERKSEKPFKDEYIIKILSQNKIQAQILFHWQIPSNTKEHILTVLISHKHFQKTDYFWNHISAWKIPMNTLIPSKPKQAKKVTG